MNEINRREFVERMAAAAGAQLRVVVGSSPMRRILELTAADQVLNIYPTLAAALADGQPPDRS